MEPKESLFCIENFSSGILEISRKGDSIIFKCIPIKNEDEVYQHILKLTREDVQYLTLDQWAEFFLPKVEVEAEPIQKGELVIAWDKDLPQDAIIARYARGEDRDYQPSYICSVRGENLWFTNAVKFESMEQYEKIRRGKEN